METLTAPQRGHRHRRSAALSGDFDFDFDLAALELSPAKPAKPALPGTPKHMHSRSMPCSPLKPRLNTPRGVPGSPYGAANGGVAGVADAIIDLNVITYTPSPAPHTADILEEDSESEQDQDRIVPSLVGRDRFGRRQQLSQSHSPSQEHDTIGGMGFVSMQYDPPSSPQTPTSPISTQSGQSVTPHTPQNAVSSPYMANFSLGNSLGSRLGSALSLQGNLRSNSQSKQDLLLKDDTPDCTLQDVTFTSNHLNDTTATAVHSAHNSRNRDKDNSNEIIVPVISVERIEGDKQIAQRQSQPSLVLEEHQSHPADQEQKKKKRSKMWSWLRR